MTSTLAAYPVLAKERYVKRNDRVRAQLHFNVCRETGVKLDNTDVNIHVYKSQKKKVMKAGWVTIL